MARRSGLGAGLAIVGRALQDLFYPPLCLACRAPLPSSVPPLFCAGCRPGVKLLSLPLCSCCGRPLGDWAGGNHPCGNCVQKPPHFRRARAALLYIDPIARVLQACKYHGELAGLTTLTTLARQAPALADLGDFDYILPVPLHIERLRLRGFNQALLLARALFPEERLAIRSDLLLRCRHTAPQTGMSGGNRRVNLRGAFAVPAPELLRNRRILLVDDVFTTGSTVNECAKVLANAGADDIQVLTLARVRD